MRLHRRLWVAVMVVFLLASPLAAVADDVESGPRAVVQETVDQVLGVLRQGELTRNQKLEQVREIVYQRFDFVVVSRLVLAKNWKRLNPQQRKEFVREFKVFLVANTSVDELRNLNLLGVQ